MIDMFTEIVYAGGICLIIMLAIIGFLYAVDLISNRRR